MSSDRRSPGSEALGSEALGSEALAHWRSEGWLHLPGLLADRVADLVAWTTDLQARPETPGAWMKYFEVDDSGERRLCRVERFLEHHAGFAALFADGRLVEPLTQLMESPPCLFKEKINFKDPGGQGFEAHQDAPAFTPFGAAFHVTALIAVDASDEANGCLELSPGHRHTALLPMTPGQTLAPEVVAELPWRALPTQPGDVVFFDSFLPHRSGPNTSTRPRRALYITWNRASEGDHRAAYFRLKRMHFPPDCEREAGRRYEDGGPFNVGNPISTRRS